MMQKKWQLQPRQRETRWARGWHRTGYASYSKVTVLYLPHGTIKQFLLTVLRPSQSKCIFLSTEMKQLESHPMFNPAIKVSDVPQKEKKVLPVSNDKEDLGFSLFEQAEKDTAAEKGSNKPDK